MYYFWDDLRTATMGNEYKYFKRDISWLSFNYLVLLEAANKQLPVYERINFISIHSSNLEEFYRVRVADFRAVANGYTREENEDTREEARQTLTEIDREVRRQQAKRTELYQDVIEDLAKLHIYFYQSNREVHPMHFPFIHQYFDDEIFPYLQPVPVKKDVIHTFLRDNRLYMAVRGKLRDDPDAPYEYFILKLPYSKVPRFIELPSPDDNFYLMYIEDIIKMNIHKLFPGYDIEGSFCFKISRDADIFIDDVITRKTNLAKELQKKVKRRKMGAVCRFVYDQQMPDDYLHYLTGAFGIDDSELSPCYQYLNMEDLRLLPNPKPELTKEQKPVPMRLFALNEKESVFNYISKKDLLLHYPYHSFAHFIHFLYEAVHDPECTDIMITQYRVAENSAVINTLIAAAQNGKRVTVFVELKARFDEENNLATAQMMQAAGIHIIFSIPKLKVHAKVVLVLRRNKEDKVIRSYGCVSTGNFNEQTANLYSDVSLFTSKPTIINDLKLLFDILQKEPVQPKFKRLLVAQFNLVPRLTQLIQREIQLAKSGKRGRIVLKMNALQDKLMIDELYKASEAGVEIDLIIRGACCLIPNQPYSRNIRVTRIVDTFLEHARIWYFGNDGNPKLFLGSPDWMRRNLYRRIEAVAPVLDPSLKQELVEMLRIQLQEHTKACFVDEGLNNVPKYDMNEDYLRPQYVLYDYLKAKNQPR